MGTPWLRSSEAKLAAALDGILGSVEVLNRARDDGRQAPIDVVRVNTDWETHFLVPLLVLTRRGSSTGKNQYW